jgi:hypothetical protein
MRPNMLDNLSLVIDHVCQEVPQFFQGNFERMLQIKKKARIFFFFFFNQWMGGDVCRVVLP